MWGGHTDKKCLHKLKWDRVCRPVEFMGLGIRDLELTNLALLAKMAWRVFDNPDSEVTRLLKAKYFSDSDF